jgi:hypothetical protein
MIESLYSDVTANKKYKLFPKDFVLETISNNPKLSVKEIRQKLRESSIAYIGLKHDYRMKELWSFVKSKTTKPVSVLDLGAGEVPKYYSSFSKICDISSYSAVDIYDFSSNMPSGVEFFHDNVLSPSMEWKDKNYDLIMMLNLIPVIERQKPGSGMQLISRSLSHCSFLIVGLPMRSLGSRRFIGNFWNSWIDKNISKERIVEVLQTPSEKFLLLRGNAPPGN